MLKLNDYFDFDDLEKWGFKRVYIVDTWAWQLEYREGTFYKETITIFEKNREVQCLPAIYLLGTLYDMIKTNWIVKVGDE